MYWHRRKCLSSDAGLYPADKLHDLLISGEHNNTIKLGKTALIILRTSVTEESHRRNKIGQPSLNKSGEIQRQNHPTLMYLPPWDKYHQGNRQHFSLIWVCGWRTGPWFNTKMSSYQYRKSHCGDKTILRPSYLHTGISYTGKTASLYWIGAQVNVFVRMTKQAVASANKAATMNPPEWLLSIVVFVNRTINIGTNTTPGIDVVI